MLKEFMENTPINLNLTAQEFQNILMREMTSIIYENCAVNIAQNNSDFTSAEIEKIAAAFNDTYKKISASLILPPNQKTLVINSIMSILFDLWQKSSATELFFIKIRQYFTPAQIVSALAVYVGDFNKFQKVTDFFAAHKQIFPKQNKKIRTIAIYFPSIFNGGTERFISFMIPIYIRCGYRVALFTDRIYPHSEYPTPPLRGSTNVLF